MSEIIADDPDPPQTRSSSYVAGDRIDADSAIRQHCRLQKTFGPSAAASNDVCADAVREAADPATPKPTITTSIFPGTAGFPNPNTTLTPARLDLAASSKPGTCLSQSEIEAFPDPDFARNKDILRNPNLCVSIERFTEGSLQWTLQVVKNLRRPGPLWAVPHDNEDEAFSTAAFAVLNYGGVVVAVEAAEERFNAGQDPNRNFGVPQTPGACPRQKAPAPQFTRRFMMHVKASRVIVALHNTLPSGGTIGMDRPSSNETPFLAPAGENAARMNASPKHIVYFAGKAPATSPAVLKEAAWLNGKGINAMYETVTKENNSCSMSNYVALRGGGLRYFNIEAPQGSPQDQLDMLKVLMERVNIMPSPSGEPPAIAPTSRLQLPAPAAIRSPPAAASLKPKGLAAQAREIGDPRAKAAPAAVRAPRDLKPALPAQ